MNRQSIWIGGVVVIFAIGLITASNSFTDVSGETSVKPSAPRYSETCAHGHNGFGCNLPQHRIDISELQERISELEERVSQLEKTR